MINYLDPTAPLLVNPIGIDKEIQNIQIAIQDGVAWLGDKAYGRAFKQELVKIIPGSARRKQIFYPEVYQATGEPLTLMPNDNVQAYSFFYLRDPAKAIDYEPLHNTAFTYQASIVVWANLQKIDPTKVDRYTEYLKTDILNILRQFSGVYVTQLFDSYENVFANYTILEEYREYMKPPNTAFRIDFDLSFKNLLPGC